MDAADAKQEEDRGRVGRAHDGAEQEGLQPGEPEEEPRRDADERRRQHDAERGERDGGQRRLAEARELRAEAGIEKDDGERQAAEEIGGGGVVEFQSEPVFARDEADGEEDQQDRRAEAERDPACEDRCHDEPGADQDRQVHALQHRRRALRW